MTKTEKALRIVERIELAAFSDFVKNKGIGRCASSDLPGIECRVNEFIRRGKAYTRTAFFADGNAMDRESVLRKALSVVDPA